MNRSCDYERCNDHPANIFTNACRIHRCQSTSMGHRCENVKDYCHCKYCTECQGYGIGG